MVIAPPAAGQTDPFFPPFWELCTAWKQIKNLLLAPGWWPHLWPGGLETTPPSHRWDPWVHRARFFPPGFPLSCGLAFPDLFLLGQLFPRLSWDSSLSYLGSEKAKAHILEQQGPAAGSTLQKTELPGECLEHLRIWDLTSCQIFSLSFQNDNMKIAVFTFKKGK